MLGALLSEVSYNLDCLATACSRPVYGWKPAYDRVFLQFLVGSIQQPIRSALLLGHTVSFCDGPLAEYEQALVPVSGIRKEPNLTLPF